MAGLLEFSGQAQEAQITNCLQVLKLSPEEADSRKAAKISGIVTCYVPGSGLCFVQDSSGGVYVQPSAWLKELKVGDEVEVSGTTAAGLFSPTIDAATIRRLGSRALPSPRRISIEELRSGRMDCQWVEVSGVVQVQEKRTDHIYFQIWTGGASAEILVFGEGNSPDLIDRKVRVKGVAGTFHEQKRLNGFGLFVPTLEQITPEDTLIEIFSRPIRNVDRLAWYSPEGSLDHRIHLKGIVTFFRSPNLMFLKDDTGSIGVEPSGKPEVKEGDEVEVSGFIRDATANPRLARARLRVLGHAERVEPTIVSIKQLESLEYLSTLVEISGVVIELSGGEKGPYRAIIASDGERVAINSITPFPKALKGCRVKAAGVWTTIEGNSPELLIASANAVNVLTPGPSDVTADQNTRILKMAAVGFGAAVLMGIWALVLKYGTRKVAEENNLLKKQLADARFEVEQMTENREGLGRDLHDHIIQSIYAVGLNVEDCHGLIQTQPDKVASRLKTATIDINAVIGELRNMIMGLEGTALKPKELRTALKSLALTMGQENSSRIRVELEQEALEALTSGQATEMLYISREAMSNSIRHGSATTLAISLRLVNGSARFSIEDNGKGFNLEERKEQGFGLRNMSKRAEKLSATFKIESLAGRGTRIVLDIPVQKQHFSISEPHSRFNR